MTDPRAKLPADFISLAATASITGLPVDDALLAADVHFPLTNMAAGDVLYEAGCRFSAVYLVRTGSFKTLASLANRIDQVVTFSMVGDVMGIDGISAGSYPTSVHALDTSQVVVISYRKLSLLGLSCRQLGHLTHLILGKAITRTAFGMMLLGSRRAKARVAAFLLDVGERMGQHGYSRTAFLLRMSRQEIGSYLGLSLETVSRIFSHLRSAGIIETRSSSRDVTILDEAALRAISCGAV